MSKTIYSVIIISIAFLPAMPFAQDTVWTKTYGDAGYDGGMKVLQTSDQGYIVLGFTYSFGAGSCDIWLIKTDAQGDTLWTKTIGDFLIDAPYDIQKTTDGGYIIIGSTEFPSAGENDVYLIKTDSLGDTLWTRTFGGTSYERGYSVQQTGDGGYIVVGYTYSYGAGSYDVYLIKTDSLGDTLWTKTFGGTSMDYGNSVLQTLDGGYLITGWTSSYGAGGSDVYIIKTDSFGDTVWTKTYGGTSGDFGEDVKQTPDGGYIVAGYTFSFGVSAFQDVWLIRTDANGDTLWTKTCGGDGSDEGHSIQQTSDGGYIIAGNTNSFGAGNRDFYLVRIDAHGNTLWTKTLGGINDDWGFFGQQTSDGGYIIIGGTQSFGAGSQDVYLVKVETDVGIEEMFPSPKIKDTLPAIYCHTFFQDRISIRFSESLNQSLKIALYNIYGGAVFEPPFSYVSNSLTIQDERLQKLGSGVYFLSVFSEKRKLGQIKLIKP
jgi:hypothetical protein